MEKVQHLLVVEAVVDQEAALAAAVGRALLEHEPQLDELAASGQRAKIYTCGPDAMMAAVARLCEARGVLCEASLETPMACGYGVCLGCPIPKRSGGYLYACTEGPCVDASSIAWKEAAR